MTTSTLILGGARSGKSLLAERLAEASGLEKLYIATGLPGDEEMAARIAHHRERRTEDWRTIEEPKALADALVRHAQAGRCLLVDCLTLWLTHVLCDDDPLCFERERKNLLEVLPGLAGEVLLVSNEVGLGVVPMGELSRRFVDEAGRLNQAIARLVPRVLFVAAGLPLALKGNPV
ncbi:bifunctional adenosylcobinamide kinase/adenosylcobinamide-phosphate guanylyltransferase [Dyella sp.]|uniref:bifunctional adenosylcobinamide kinase/adenosylcobinamide-phosphate guanylyltransferase n=1 Tax=Dyella sp. TaxID=1869338 RepID=UPI002ED26EBA